LPDQDTQVRHCAACGNEVPSRASICGRCGHPVAAPENPDAAKPDWIKRLGPIGVGLAFILPKLKLILLALAKYKTFLSMFATMGLYWTIYGWRFAVGFVLGIYIHEMGHVFMLKHYGLRASAPMFIPGFGAFVSMYDSPANVGQDARIGLAGPLFGAGAALLTLLPAYAGFGPVWLAIAHATAYINLFNLTPIWTLDGGRASRALDFRQRLYLLGLVGVLWYFTQEGILLIVLLGAGFRFLWQRDHAPEPDDGAFALFAGLVLFFAAMLAWIPRN
jgi:Zn-dependent protease